MGNVNYTFLCNGGDVALAAPAITSRLVVTNSISSIIASGQGDS